jgi:hypothetical protein
MLGGGKRGSSLFGHRLTFASGALAVAAIVAAISVAGAVRAQGAAKPAAAAAPIAPAQFVWLDQNWSADERGRFHHQSQGTLTLPFRSEWILALEQPGDSGGMFTDPAYLETFGFIPSPRDPANNPNGLPVGFARTTGFDPRDNQPFDRIGFTCAACHTGRLDFNGTAILIDGGPALTDLNGFGTNLAVAFLETWVNPARFRRFADRVLGPSSNFFSRLDLHARLGQVLVEQGVSAATAKIALRLSSGPNDVAEGFGRLDALNRIGNTVFGDIHRGNNVALTAPVAYPHIWDTHWFSWVQYNGSIEQPMVRNAGEAMGVGAIVNFSGNATPRFTSTIPIGLLYSAIERPLRGPEQPQANRRFTGLTSPAWPEQILGQINRPLAAEGAQLYAQRCQGCHLPAPNSAAFWTDGRWQAPNAAGERYLNLEMKDVGTDPAQARDMANRTVRVPLSFGLTGALSSSGGWGVYDFGPALSQVVERSANRWYDANNVPPATRPVMNGNRANNVQHPLRYKARPLNGVWATPPFLHNGSIRTVWDLLSPYRERPASFHLGSHDYDPVRLGYADAGGFELVSVAFAKNGPPGVGTPVPGNMNTGHLFDTADALNQGRGIIGPFLSEHDRFALIEFLKTL